MIQHLSGTIIGVDSTQVILDVGGIGFAVAVPRPELYCVAQKTELITYMHWNQETGPQLFGFATENERQSFALIISCSGIGPKIGIAILSQMTAHDFLACISLADTKRLSTLKGIGLKKAEAMVLHLQDKVKKLSFTPSQQDSGTLSMIKNIHEVLQSLHYAPHEISRAIEHIKQQDAFASSTFDELLRKSLTYLAKAKNNF